MAENYNLIFGSNASQSYTWSDVDYQKGWETVGDTPPLGEQFDALQRRADNKAKDLNDRLTPIESNNTNIFRQPSTAYALKDIRFYSELPAGWYFECKVAGTTDAGDITMLSPILENDTVVDGTVTWTIRKISSGGGEAVGVIKAFAGNGDIPSGYLLCDGSAVSRTMFPDLFSAIGTTYGSGDGSTTFNLPDYNTAQRFAQGGTVAGTVKSAGLPNIEGYVRLGEGSASAGTGLVRGASGSGAFIDSGDYTSHGPARNSNAAANMWKQDLTFDASTSNPIYGNSDTVQPDALTTRYIIKAFDGQTADSALIDITQYAQELAGKANITGSNLVHHRDVINTSGTYTAPVTGLYKITVKGGGGGGAGAGASNGEYMSGGGGGEGGTTIGFEKMDAGQTSSVVIGAGGAGGSAGYHSSTATAGGNSTVTVNGNVYTGNGGTAASYSYIAGGGGDGTIPGACGSQGITSASNINLRGGSGGGSGGSNYTGTAKNGGGGGGGVYSPGTAFAGGAGGDGYVWFEYYTPGA